MKTRAMGVSVVASDRIDASTFHTFGANLLRSHGSLIDISPDFDILDEEQAEELAKEAAQSAVSAISVRRGVARGAEG
ncbi:MAG TPA: UvrD-helicase domain-containing protein [Solirubrobacteraceae bacterium]